MTDHFSSADIQAFAGGSCAGWQIEVVAETDSTNTRLKERAKAGAPEKLLLAAERQTAGRGRLGRSFLSPEGGIYFSLLVRPNIPLEGCTDLTVAAAVCTARAVEKLCGLRLDIKWVNDLYADGKKLCGILTEGAALPNGMTDYAVVGIGLNLQKPNCGDDKELADLVTGLTEQGCTVSRPHLIAAILAEFDRYYADMEESHPQVVEEYRRRMFLTGKEVTLSTDPQKRPHTVVGVDDRAGLLVRTPQGEVISLHSGEVSVRRF